MTCSRIILVCSLAAVLVSATPEYQNGRIVEVQKTVNTKTLYWVVNTPITQDETTFTISVQVKDKIFTGSYELSKVYGAPPEDWAKNHPVKVQIDGDTMYLQAAASGIFKLHIAKRKAAPGMQPLTPEELAGLGEQPSAQQSLIGFDKPVEKSKPQPATPPAPAPPQESPSKPAEGPTGSVSVRSTPYLAEIYVDGNDMGYAPAKINLSPGKHTVRLEKLGYKSWTKEITMTAGSELNLDATLERK
ncbi:MAG: PEGA domain-containing protein [Acidobacteriia bacterium]|nr:PEGA domain-containing protein [Terriglobia bacterium]